MKILDGFKFFELSNTDEYSNIRGNVNAESLELEITGTASSISIEVETKVDSENGEWVVRKGVNYKNITTLSTITEKGQYSFPISGVCQIRIHNKATSKGNIIAFGMLVG